MSQNKKTRTAEIRNLFLSLDREGQEYMWDLLESMISVRSAAEWEDRKKRKECAQINERALLLFGKKSEKIILMEKEYFYGIS